MSKSLILAFVALSVLILVSCKSDKVVKYTYDLEGNWKMYEAFRNDVATNTLQDGYFLFKDSILETNIVGSPIIGPFIMIDHSFKHKSDLPVQYDITYFKNDTLHLNTIIQGFEFQFMLQKSMDTIPEI